MYEKLKAAIHVHTRKHRLVFWYDQDGTHKDALDQLEIPADVVQIDGNEWWIKHRVLMEKPETHFLLYAPYVRPDDEDNWLLDLVLAGFAFSTDLSQTYREELGLGPEFFTFITDHVTFFKNARDRFAPLQELVDPDNETTDTLAVKMMGVLTAEDGEGRRTPRPFSDIFLTLAEHGFVGRRESWEQIVKFGLDGAFRRELKRFLPQISDDIEPHGAAIGVFREVWKLERGGEMTALRRNSRVLLHEWRDRSRDDRRYRKLVLPVEAHLGIAEEVVSLSTEELAGLYLFPAVDAELVQRLVVEVTRDAADWPRIRDIAGQRSSSWWVRGDDDRVAAVYRLVIAYIDFEQLLQTADLGPAPAAELADRYISSLYRIDHLFRHALLAYRAADSAGTLSEIVARLEGRYTHHFLQRLSELWDQARHDSPSPVPNHIRRQRTFFDGVVAPYLERGDKLVVIVSDGLRYEVGRELTGQLSGVNRLTAECDVMAAAVPTVTAAGMNALLPHTDLTMDTGGTVTIDGVSPSGIEGRSKYLAREVAKRFPGKQAAAFKGTDLVSLSTAAARETVQGLDLVYVYSNGIDAAADNAKTEKVLPDAVETELRFLTGIVRKFANQLNRTHMLITADHGFLYQSNPPDVTQLIAAETPDQGVRDTRFIIGGLKSPDHFRTYSDLGAAAKSDAPVHFAEGLYRVRKQGGGIRYVHGGVSLQELLIPLIKVRAGRNDDVAEVSVSILKPANAVITTPTYGVTFFQENPASHKHKPVTLRMYFRAQDQTVLSDTVEITFDSEDPTIQNRSTAAEFVFTPEAIRYNNQSVVLVQEKLVGGTPTPYGEEVFMYRTFGERDF